MPNPIEIIKKDHETVKQLFEKYNALGENATKEKDDISKQIIKELAVHAKMEEKLFYPKIKEVLNDEHPMLVEEAIAEHHGAKVTLLELKIMSVDNPKFDGKMKFLEESIMHHVEEEEKEMLPLAEESLTPDDMETLGQEMQDFSEDAKKSILDKVLG